MYVLTVVNSGGSKAENVVSKAKKKDKERCVCVYYTMYRLYVTLHEKTVLDINLRYRPK